MFCKMGSKASREQNRSELPRQLPYTTGPLERKPRFLCLHGRGTNGYILSCQTAAFRANTKIDMNFIDAPHEAKGEIDPGILLFYPNQCYYDWFYKRDDGLPEEKSLNASMELILDEIRRNGPYDGLLGFSQGGSMVTRILKYLDDTGNNIFRCAVLIGAVAPKEWFSSDGLILKQVDIKTSSLHIMGEADPYFPRSQALLNFYNEDYRRTMVHSEGHQIPSIRTNLYGEVRLWIYRATTCIYVEDTGV